MVAATQDHRKPDGQTGPVRIRTTPAHTPQVSPDKFRGNFVNQIFVYLPATQFIDNPKRSAGMRGFHRNGHGVGRRIGKRGDPFGGAIWMIGIGIMMLWGHWWPGILVLIGISMVLGAFWNAPEAREMSDTPRSYMPPETPAPTQTPSQPVEFNRVPSIPRPAPVTSQPRIELLPASCPRCGAPVRSPDVKWRGENFAACAYCGSNVVTNKPPKL